MFYKSSLRQLSENREILIHGESFAYILPCTQLRALISNFTISFPDAAILPDAYTIMPHGSVTLVFFYYKAELHSFLFGPTTKPIKVGDLANKCDVIFIIEFQPAGFSCFNQINQKELTDKIIPFSLLDAYLDKRMRSVLKTALSAEELLLEFEQILIRSMRFPYPEELRLAVRAIIQRDGAANSAKISNQAFYCPRHLNRLFNLYLGMSMKAFSRLVRINKSIQLLNKPHNSATFICEKLGYYDISHFVKDFKRICHITPQEYKRHMSDFYSEIAKF